MSTLDLRAVETHFAFGENWRSFIDTIDEESVTDAERGLAKLFPADELLGKRFLDIGSGSGLSMLAASNLGAAEVVGVDIDSSSVAATTALLTPRLGDGWSVQVKSVFDIDPAVDGTFDVVHSWGVLHHTGDMWTAVRKAAAMVYPGGQFALALYRKTPMCGIWRVEKRFYTSAPPAVQAILRWLFKAAFALAMLVRGRNPIRYLKGYRTVRGMDTNHDLHDWLGGYPYESASPQQVAAFLDGMGFTLVRSFTVPQTIGLFGSGCDEYVFVRRT